MVQKTQEQTPGTRRGRPRDPAKREAILQAAARLFLNQGFEQTSMDAIAAAAGVSKLTVYSHFADKDDLFQRMVEDKCDHYSAPDSFVDFEAKSVRTSLRKIGEGFLALLLDPETLALHRMMIRDSERVPRINRLFIEAGPQRLTERVEAYIRRLNEAGALDADDPQRAAEQLLVLFKGRPHMDALLGLNPLPGKAELDRHIDACVDTFLRAFGRRGRTQAKR